MNFLMTTLTRGTKVHPVTSDAEKKTFTQIWKGVEQQFKNAPFKLNTRVFLGDEEEKYEYDDVEKYAWVDERLEDMSSRLEDDDDQEKNEKTFGAWTSETLLTIDTNYDYVDALLEKMASRVEEDDDEERDLETFIL